MDFSRRKIKLYNMHKAENNIRQMNQNRTENKLNYKEINLTSYSVTMAGIDSLATHGVYRWGWNEMNCHEQICESIFCFSSCHTLGKKKNLKSFLS